MDKVVPQIHSVPRSATNRRPSWPTPIDHWLLRQIQNQVRSAPLRFVLWDGFELASTASPIATILFKTRSALLGWIWNPELHFGETFTSGDVEIRGDLLAVLESIYREFEPHRSRLSWRPRANDVRAASDNVHHHYDLGNEFYRLWLDREMVYTCAYFPSREASLEDAQIAKMDLVCRKLRLTAGEQVVEAGCGWGALAIFMARHYGVTVRAFNLSTEQLAYARQRAAREGLSGRIEFIDDDYRNVTGTYDAFVSIGMLEHVGLAHYRTLGQVMDRSLGAHGRALLHFIGRNQPLPLNPWIRRHIFPGAYAPALREVFEGVLEPHSFSVADVENLRLHYAKTLEHWRHRFDDHANAVTAMFDETFVRIWRLYLAGSQAAFSTGVMQLFQVLVNRQDDNQVPWRRATY